MTGKKLPKLLIFMMALSIAGTNIKIAEAAQQEDEKDSITVTIKQKISIRKRMIMRTVGAIKMESRFSQNCVLLSIQPGLQIFKAP